MMRVFIFKSNARGMQYGVGTYIRTLTAALRVFTDLEVFLVSYRCAGLPEVQVCRVADGQTNISIPAPNQPFEVGDETDRKYAAVVAHILEPWLREGGPVVFHFNSADALPLMLRLKEKYPYPSVGVVHFAEWQILFNGNKKKLEELNVFEPSTDVEYTLSLERKFYEACDGVVSVTRYMKDFLVNYYGIDGSKIEVIPNGIEPVPSVSLSPDDKAALKQVLGFRAEDQIVLFVGRIDESKGVLALVDAFADVCRTHESVRLVLSGEGQISECLQRSHAMKGRLCFTGFLSPAELEDYYRIADLGVIPSLYDHCPYSLLELVAHKIPLIVSRIEGLTEIFNPDQCRFVDVNILESGDVRVDIPQLASAMDGMLYEMSLGLKPKNQSAIELSEAFTSQSMGQCYRNRYQLLSSLGRIDATGV